jgi:hypothetical protein
MYGGRTGGSIWNSPVIAKALSLENQLILACSMHYKRLVLYPVPYRVDPRFGGPAISPIDRTSHLVEPGDTLKDIFPSTMNR